MHYIGIDIGGTKIAGGIVTNDGNIITRVRRPTPIKEGGQRILQDAIEVAKSLMQGFDHNIPAVGIGAGGHIDTLQGIVHSTIAGIPGWLGIRVTETFTYALGLPSAVENDAHVLALAEYRFGAARLFPNGTVVFLALGTGIGGSLLSKGAVHHGANWSAGAFGRIRLTMDPNARRDNVGTQGTLDAYCSGSGLVQTWRELTGSTDSGVTGYDVARDAQVNPKGHGSQAIAKTGEYLGHGLVILANVLDPDLFVIGGGLSELGDALLEPARRVLKQHALPGPATCPVVTAQLGVDAAIVGAASLVMSGGTDTVYMASK